MHHVHVINNDTNISKHYIFFIIKYHALRDKEKEQVVTLVKHN